MADFTFRAQKMIDRCMREGNGDLLTEETVAFIKSLDGKVGTDYNWQSVVKGEDNLVWIAEANTYVNKVDCD